MQLNIKAAFGEEFSVSKVKELCKKLGWLAEKTRYCQLDREVNWQKRLDVAQECIASNDQFENVIWSDECNVQLDWNGTLTFHRNTRSKSVFGQLFQSGVPHPF